MQIQYFNNLRALACFLVILTHSAMPSIDDSFGVYMVLFALMGSPSSELFVTLSSSLLAPSKQEMFVFYKKRFSKLLGPFFFWSLVILFIEYSKNEIGLQKLTQKLLLFPIAPVAGVYWFVYAICGLYLIIPIISPWLAKSSKKELLGVLLIWGTTLLFPFLNLLFNEEIYNSNGSYYFITVYLGGFIGYLFLGVYLRKYPILFTNKLKCILFIALLITLGTIPILYGYLFNRDILVVTGDNLSLSSALYVISIFCFFQNFKFSSVIESFFNTIAKYSFGIYLVHIIVIRRFIWKLLENHRLPHPVLETPIIAISSLLICLLIVKLLSALPKSKYIIGA